MVLVTGEKRPFVVSDICTWRRPAAGLSRESKREDFNGRERATSMERRVMKVLENSHKL